MHCWRFLFKYTFMKLKTPKELGITRTQFRNIARLCMFVKDKVPPPQFDIKQFYTEAPGGDQHDGERPGDASYSCGTSACFCGYGPLAGIRPMKEESWFGYASRVFGASICSEVFSLLFEERHLNDRDAAVKRGAFFLTKGIPEGVWLDTWEAPKSFRPPWKLIVAAAA